MKARSLSIRIKMIAVVAGTLIAAIVVIAFLVRGIVYDSIVRNKRTTVDILTASMIHDIKYGGETGNEDIISEVIAKYMTYYRIIRRITFYDEQGVCRADSDPTFVGQRNSDSIVESAIKVARPTLEVTRRSRNNLGIRSVAPVLRGSSVLGAVDIDVSIVDIQKTLSSIDRRIALILAATVICASAVLFFAFREVILKSLGRLIAMTHEIAKGNYDVQAGAVRADEIGELTGAFDKMARDLRKSREELDSYNKHLEERIQEATSELQRAYEELKNAQGQLVLNEKMASLGVLISGIAHEINTPVGAILNVSRHMRRRTSELPQGIVALLREPQPPEDSCVRFLGEVIGSASRTMAASHAGSIKIERLLRERGVPDARRKAETLAKLNLTDEERILPFLDCLKAPSLFALADTFGSIAQTAQIAETSSQKISEIVRALKYYAYADKDRAEQIQINESIEIALVLLRNSLKNKVDVRASYDPDLPKIFCTSEVHQIWTNLVSNSCDAVEDLGEDHAGRIEIATRRRGDEIVVTVEDNGCGIPEDRVARIFDPFVTFKDIGKGTGLGLSIVSGIVKKLKGTVGVTSRPGRTVFEVVLPITGSSGSQKDPEAGSRESIVENPPDLASAA